MKKLSITEFHRMACKYMPGAQFIFDTSVQTDDNVFLPHVRGVHSFRKISISLSPNAVWFFNQPNNKDDMLAFHCVKHIETRDGKDRNCLKCTIVCDGSFGGECRYEIIIKK